MQSTRCITSKVGNLNQAVFTHTSIYKCHEHANKIERGVRFGVGACMTTSVPKSCVVGLKPENFFFFPKRKAIIPRWELNPQP